MLDTVGDVVPAIIAMTVDQNGSIVPIPGELPSGLTRSVSNGITSRSVSSKTPLISVRLTSSNQSKFFRILETNIICTTQDEIFYEIIKSPALTGASFSSSGSGSITEFDISATSMSGGTVIHSGFTRQGIIKDSDFFEKLKTEITSTEIITIAVTPFSGSASMAASITIHEVS